MIITTMAECRDIQNLFLKNKFTPLRVIVCLYLHYIVQAQFARLDFR